MPARKKRMIETEFADLGIELYRFDEKTTRAKIACTGGSQHCGGTHDTALNCNAPPDGIAANFRRAGWNFRAGKWQCPSCQTTGVRKRLSAESSIDKPVKPLGYITSLPKPPPPSATEVISHAMKKIWRAAPDAEREEAMTVKPAAPEPEDDGRPNVKEILKVAGKLNLYFSAGRYEKGWSDRRIADELDMPVSKVASIREESDEHGPIIGDPELDDVRTSLLTLREMLDEQIARLDEYEREHAHA